jgi:hypothetical protein
LNVFAPECGFTARRFEMMIRKFTGDFAERLAAAVVCLLFLFSTATFAGPPLVCHVFEIGNAKSLPWTSPGWNLTGSESYHTKKLAFDTIALLDSDTDANAIVHMETLRRATLYARKDPVAAKELLTKLIVRAQAAGGSARAALANFDAGYLAEAYKQWMGQDEPNPARGLDGYALVSKALAARGSDPEMEFAAALITLQGPANEHARHAQRAIAGAKNDPLLARNLSSRFHGAQSETVAEMIYANPQVKTVAKP